MSEGRFATFIMEALAASVDFGRAVEFALGEVPDWRSANQPIRSRRGRGRFATLAEPCRRDGLVSVAKVAGREVEHIAEEFDSVYFRNRSAKWSNRAA